MKSFAYRPTTLLLAVTMAVTASAAAFEVDTMPPAGLYHVETDSQMSVAGAGNRTLTDNGSSITDKTTANGVSYQQTYSKAPTTKCMGSQAQQMAIAAKMGASCPVHSERRGVDGLVLSMQCNGTSTQTTTKRTGAATWTYDIVTSNSAGGAAPTSPQAIMERKIAEIEQMRKLALASGKSTANLPTDAQIARMKQQMQGAAQKMQQELDQLPADKRAAMQAAYARTATGGAMPMHLQQRYTRIGESCTPG